MYSSAALLTFTNGIGILGLVRQGLLLGLTTPHNLKVLQDVTAWAPIHEAMDISFAFQDRSTSPKVYKGHLPERSPLRGEANGRAFPRTHIKDWTSRTGTRYVKLDMELDSAWTWCV